MALCIVVTTLWSTGGATVPGSGGSPKSTVLVGVWVAVSTGGLGGVFVGVSVAVGTGVLIGVSVLTALWVGVSVAVGVSVGVTDGLAVCVIVGVVAAFVGVSVLVLVAV